MEGSDRTWTLPSRSWGLRMQWHDLLFMHWPIAAHELTPYVPDGLNVDTYEGQGWIGVVPFRMSDVAPRGVPAVPWLSAFPELNVRTYVTVDNKPGVWFFSLDATNPLAVRLARSCFHLPYMDARISVSPSGEWIHYQSRRTHRGEPPVGLQLKYRPRGAVFSAHSGTLEHWLTARYCLYTVNARGRMLRGEIDHAPWPLQQAEADVVVDTMLDPLRLTVPEADPHLLFSKHVTVRAWTNEPVG